jgi:hypothetical protein
VDSKNNQIEAFGFVETFSPIKPGNNAFYFMDTGIIPQHWADWL